MNAIELWILLSLAVLMVYPAGLAAGERAAARRDRRFNRHADQAIEVTER